MGLFETVEEVDAFNDFIYRMRGGYDSEAALILLKAIIAHCETCKYSLIVKNCDVPDCPLYPYRLGEFPLSQDKRGEK